MWYMYNAYGDILQIVWWGVHYYKLNFVKTMLTANIFVDWL